MAQKKRLHIYGVVRIDDQEKHSHAWIVTVQRRKRVWHAQFSDGRHGGNKAALEAAIEYRDKVLRQHPPITIAQHVSQRRKNNHSGVAGVCRSTETKIIHDKVIERPFWIAYWTIDSRRKYVKFSIARHGEKGAFKLACKARKKGLAELAAPYVNSKGLRQWMLHNREVDGRSHASMPARRDGLKAKKRKRIKDIEAEDYPL